MLFPDSSYIAQSKPAIGALMPPEQCKTDCGAVLLEELCFCSTLAMMGITMSLGGHHSEPWWVNGAVSCPVSPASAGLGQ